MLLIKKVFPLTLTGETSMEQVTHHGPSTSTFPFIAVHAGHKLQLLHLLTDSTSLQVLLTQLLLLLIHK